MKKNLLSIGGFDPSSGAGVVLDAKVFESLGFHGTGLVTAVTVQNTRVVKDFFALSPALLRSQFEALKEDIPISGIKVGMIASRRLIPVVAEILASARGIPRVVDPVFKSTSGAWLIEENAVRIYIRALAGKATVITPNMAEASLIARMPVRGVPDMQEAARRIHGIIGFAVLVKGGHLSGQAVNVLYDGKDLHLFTASKLRGEVHGTGCFFSSSLLAFLAGGFPLEQSSRLAAVLTRKGIKAALPLGKGQRVFSFPPRDSRNGVRAADPSPAGGASRKGSAGRS